MTQAGVREHFSLSCLGHQYPDHEEHTAKAELVGTRDKEHSGYLGKNHECTLHDN